jgi:predicted permease
LTGREPAPPRAAEWLVRKLVGGRDGESASGDLREEFTARGGGTWWYWKQALSCVWVRVSPFRRALPGLGKDFHFAFRTIRKNPGYAFAAMVCLALGIGVNTTIFSLMDELFFRPLPVPDPSRVVRLERGRDSAFLWRDTEQLRSRTRSFSGLAAYAAGITGLEVSGAMETISAEWVSADYAQTLGIGTELGRWFEAGDEVRGAERVAVISHRTWTQRFGQDRNVIGRTVRVESESYRVVGVAPASFTGVFPPHYAAVWIPYLSFLPFQKRLENNGVTRASLIGRLRPGVTMEQAGAELTAIDAQVHREYPRPANLERSAGERIHLTAASGAVPEARRVMRPLAALLLMTIAAVLLIACVNVANLMLARASVRRGEMMVRRALGASRFRLARQTLSESLLLAAGGAGLGLLLGAWTNRVLGVALPSMPPAMKVALHLDINWRVAGLTAAIGLAAALLFGLAPALEQSRPGPGRKLSRRRDAYVVVQVALSLMLLVTAGLFLRALWSAESADPGFAAEGRLTVRMFVSPPEYSERTGLVFYRRVLDEVRGVPGVVSAGLTYSLPFVFNDRVCAAAERDDGGLPGVSASVIDGDYFRAMGIPLAAGRGFDGSEAAGGSPVVIVNETFARRMWPGRPAVGETLWMGCGPGTERVARVAGVARDSKYHGIGESPEPYVYVPLSQKWTGLMVLVAETAGDPDSFSGPIRAAIARVDPRLRMQETLPLKEHVARSLWQVRWEASMLGAIGLLAMLLGAVGLYGVIAYAVAQRTREIGVRMALGAGSGDVVWMVLARGLRLTALGVSIGLLLCAGVTRFLRAFLYGVSPVDPVAFAGAALVWATVAMLASYVPARRAARVEPVVALRYE